MERLAKFPAWATLALLLLSRFASHTDAAEKAKLTLGYSSTGPTAVGL